MDIHVTKEGLHFYRNCSYKSEVLLVAIQFPQSSTTLQNYESYNPLSHILMHHQFQQLPFLLP